AAHDIRETVSPDSVTIATTYAVSVYWLMPLMPALRAAFPGVNIKMLSADAIASIEGQFDVAIRYGDGHWFGYDAVSLGATAVYPVCSPHYPGIDQIAKPADLACQSLLYLDDGRKNWMDWRDWFQSAGVSAALPVPVLRANSYIVLLQAAISGQGIALGWEQLVSEMLESGVLTRVVDVTVDTPQHFYLLRAREE
ncbi:MAG: hypothetical protein GY918_08940, partial [Gammaproteobacteria bacterium]|nr:hypothetical protein [Gammaproteobacteria bacterium]